MPAHTTWMPPSGMVVSRVPLQLLLRVVFGQAKVALEGEGRQAGKGGQEGRSLQGGKPRHIDPLKIP